MWFYTSMLLHPWGMRSSNIGMFIGGNGPFNPTGCIFA